MSGITIWHNPACSTSRKVLGMIRETGAEPRIVEYLKTPPGRDELVAAARAMGVPVRGLLRKKAPAYEELGLGDESLSEAALLDAIGAHPVLIERPVVLAPGGVRLCRPVERLWEVVKGEG